MAKTEETGFLGWVSHQKPGFTNSPVSKPIK